MTRPIAARWISVGAVAMFVGGMLAADVVAQRATPAEVAAKISGNWQINLELSPQFRPGGGRQGSVGSGGGQLLAMVGTRTSALGFQRGGGGGGGAQAAPPDPRVVAGNRAIRNMQQAPQTMTIAATVDSVTFTDPRGTRTYALDNKNIKQDVGDGASMTVKSRWDRNTLRQEFIVDETKVTHAFEVNDAGTSITFTMRIDIFSGGVGTQVRGVYEKRP
jgi:hypothetical protein